MHGFIARICVFGALASKVMCAQSSPSQPQFVSASVSRSGPEGRAGVHIDSPEIRWTFLSLKDYVGIAYGLSSYRVSGPGWIALERFDITVSLPADAVPPQVPPMLQQLLQERFQLQVHRENRDIDVYCLALGKGGPNLRKSPSDSSVETQADNVAVSSHPGDVTVNYGGGAFFKFADNQLEGRQLRTGAMADALSRFTDRPVIDMTNLTGLYDFVLELSPGDFRAMRIRSTMAAGATVTRQAIREAQGSSGASLSKAVQKLGLELEPRQERIEMLVIDHVETMPAGN